VIATSLLRAHGFENTANYTGGFSGWSRAGLPVHRAEEPLVEEMKKS
jgi:rhodanese-related sulfurtransferase